MSNQSEMPSKETILRLLGTVIDPEVGMNIVDLGLIYGVEVSDGKLRIDMTMTTPACPMGDMILDNVRRALEAHVPVEAEIDINLVWEPPWGPEKMSKSALDHFGWDE